MKRQAIILAAILVAMLTTMAAADQAKIFTLLDGATSTITGKVLRPASALRTFHAYGATASGTGSATIVIEVSNIDSPASDADWITQGTITLTLGTTRTSNGFATNAPWRNVRPRITAISGTGAAVSLIAGVEQ